jgi:hypothetical protein
MITGEQGAGKLASPVREETDGKGPGQGHLAGGPLHSARGPGKRAESNLGTAPRAYSARPIRQESSEARHGAQARPRDAAQARVFFVNDQLALGIWWQAFRQALGRPSDSRCQTG